MEDANQIKLSDASAGQINMIGLNCYNNLKLQEIQVNNASLFTVPRSVSIPMSIPVHFAIKEAAIYKKLKSMFK